MNSPVRCRSAGAIGALLALVAATLLVAACSREGAKQPAPAEEVAPAQDGAPLTTTSEDGVSIRYRIYGNGEPALIFIHCWACDSTYWDQQLDALKTRYTLVTLDLAGHGESGTARGDWSIPAFGADVAAVPPRVHDDGQAGAVDEPQARHVDGQLGRSLAG